MTDQMLRDLLQERVADLTTRDLSSAAWTNGRRTRRRERLAVVGATVVVTAALASGVAVLGDGRPTGPAPVPGGPGPSPSASGEGTSDATYQGVPVWWSPSRREEVDLPSLRTSVLPRVVDLESGPMAKALDRAVAAFAVGDRVHLVDERGRQVTVDIRRLDDVSTPDGYAYRPVHASMLSPDGRHLVFPQDGSVAIYSLDGGWSEIDTGDAVTRFVTWVRDDMFVLPPEEGGGPSAGYTVDGGVYSDLRADRLRPLFSVGDAQAYGPTRSAEEARAQSYGMGVPIPVAHAGTDMSDPEFVYAESGGKLSVLAVTWTVHEDSDSGRFLQCCPVAGWLDQETLVYESRQTDPVLVAWTVGSDDFALVSRIKGEYDQASFADLG
jgi:hypothetical protein